MLNDDMLCYVKEHDTNPDECIPCDGYNATCDDYISMRTMQTLYDNGDTLRDESRLEKIMNNSWKNPDTWSRKLRQYVRDYRLRKNRGVE